MSPLTSPPLNAAEQAPWSPEDAAFWQQQGRRLAWRTLTITTFNLLLAFATWFMVSAIVVRLEGVGFRYSTTQLFWLTAMPGLAGGTFRILHMFLIPILGTRATVTWATLSLLIPCVGWGLAVQNPQTPFWVLLLLAFLAGLGGGNFSSFMPSTSLFFPKRLQGTALGIQAGVGNLGVCVAQFLVPWIIGAAALGNLVGSPQPWTRVGQTTVIYLHNAAYFWIPFLLIGAGAAWLWLRSVPVRASFLEQTDIFREKHTWVMTSLYIMTFGSFAGFAAIFPILLKTLFGGFENAPDPLTYAFLGPLIGSVVRVAFGPISDRFGGARVTQISGIGLLVCALGTTFFTEPTSLDQFPGFLACMLGLFFFAG
ncbi:MAG: MFS transporter, partial [Gemmatales bacterium]|nr:MFS transporter [Gemmatales bacterium]MDW8224319.1 MFS transporter [Gemmatales bacterium]